MDPEEFEDEKDLFDQIEVDEPLLMLVDEGDTPLDENWINGDTCSEVFAGLSPLERRILVLYYDRGWKDAEIGEEYGFSSARVRGIRAGARKKLTGRRETVC
ncbi:sigma factor-like helix-turn-helix DNA-binding protein [Desulfofundulus sp.]|uniref:sigma factor-like helix-turn-helix DNA-binding protein n=1 Tax=Desulfofundulus sp. TaxID=2282750 RepID=UPI003C741AD2